MCTVAYNVSAVLVLCFMIDMETANKVNTLLFHAYDDIGPRIYYRNINVSYIQLDTHHMCIEVQLYNYIAVSKTMLDYVYTCYLDS